MRIAYRSTVTPLARSRVMKRQCSRRSLMLAIRISAEESMTWFGSSFAGPGSAQHVAK